MKIKNFYNIYAQSYLKLTNSDKYNAYHKLYLKLNSEIKQLSEIKNILFIHQSLNDIDYLSFLSDNHDEFNLYISGIYLSKFNKKYYYKKINNVYENYEFFNFNYQPKFNKKDWKLLKNQKEQIDLIILPSKIVSFDNLAYFKDKKLVKFIKSFINAKIIGIGFDFSYIDKNIKKLYARSIKLDKFIAIKV